MVSKDHQNTPDTMMQWLSGIGGLD